ncbi:hypothetical protein [Bacillus subtilis]|uniref:hypothetical protein n=1 Tax=Bacillus subtilis TaxID=1423 RepID=UPI0011A7BAE1|nr:hypothetical protein [Bacillus subtilis]TWG49469.1 hypothetical protein L608_000900000530 [Bacillus subtilis J23]
MTTTMQTTTKYFADTKVSAEAIVDQQKAEHGEYLKSHTITKKTKKEVEYYIVLVTVEYYKDKDLVVTEQ